MIAGSARAEAAAANSTNSDILPVGSGKFLLQGIDLSFYVKATDLPTGMYDVLYCIVLYYCSNAIQQQRRHHFAFVASKAADVYTHTHFFAFKAPRITSSIYICTMSLYYVTKYRLAVYNTAPRDI
jgi:hypothetical protein